MLNIISRPSRLSPIDSSVRILRDAIERFQPTHIVSMVSGGKDSAASDQVARELNAKIDLVIHGNTRCGIPETTQFVRDTYGKLGDLAEADAGTAYEAYVMRKGFFGQGHGAHGFAYRVLKATPFRAVVAKHLRRRQRGVRVLLLNGARKDESENRQRRLQVWRQDPAQKGNIWVNLIHDWSQDDRDSYLAARQTPINPVAKALCRSGECMCGTMQTAAERVEAAVLYPHWGSWLSELEAEVRRKHGFGWGEPFPRPRVEGQYDLFQPMCSDCLLRGGAHA
ncbi:3'-phosphoadenosine 5'-phosphosulfate sulfotransferase (PAPS reductase)/FAD synthetase [Bosea lupini]|uniref:3'-phosphoadenosine 5'-phosphosulfate sulfotransferase (PAPS reductase)/FAD synthetase n=1 Tax=Bosea lupini TaxID=1036779 RepID=A0A1H8AIV8_9HYPH|nr:phosphoadenosine phosphosulfate reductase family protein [Bosea lupini]SEM69457.1 3'-phosphoadenosine 5'-phosphosulfate sulfotransferase (PAPS reductase)/FAD synthetase [Bosea lupini]